MSKSKYTKDFKKEVGEATFEEGMSLAKVSEKFKIHPTLVRNWRLKYCKEKIPQEEKESVTDSGSANLTDDDFKNDTDILKKFDEELGLLGEDIDNSCWDGNEDLFPEEYEIMYLNAYWKKETNKKTIGITMYSPLAERSEETTGKCTYSGNFDEIKFIKEILLGQFRDRFIDILEKYGLSRYKIVFFIDYKMSN